MNKNLKANILLFITALIWGTAFTGQKLGAEHMGAFFFNSLRFACGGIFLLPILFIIKKINISEDSILARPYADFKTLVLAGISGGFLIFLGAALQQIAIAYTTTGKAAFITGLYVVLVPILGIFVKEKTHLNVWVGVVFSAVGLYFLCIKANFTFAFGDFLVFIGAFFWAMHILVVNYFSPKTNPIRFASFQFLFCAFLSFIVALIFEEISLDKVVAAVYPILYTGIMSVGIAYTLQVVAQKDAKPASAAIILSLETVFSVICGFLVLNEILSFRETFGCLLMFAGIIISQMKTFNFFRKN